MIWIQTGRGHKSGTQKWKILFEPHYEVGVFPTARRMSPNEIFSVLACCSRSYWLIQLWNYVTAQQVDVLSAFLLRNNNIYYLINSLNLRKGRS